MPAILLYLPVAIALVALWHRFVQPMRMAPAIVLVLLPFCFTGRALLTGRVYAPIDLPYMSEPLLDYAHEYELPMREDGKHVKIYNGTLSDLYMQMMPWSAAVRASLARGEWPLWNPHMLCGSLLAANMQSAPYDPLKLVALLLPQTQALTFGASITFFLAGLFAFAFARSLGLGDTASLIGAAAYMFSAMLAFFVGWPLGRAWALFPFLLTGVRLVVRDTTVRAAAVLTAAFVMILIAGHPESVLHLVTVGVAYGAMEVAATRRYRAIAVATLCGVIALLLCAIALLPFFEAAPQTAEYEMRHSFYKRLPLPFGKPEVIRRAGLTALPWYGGQPEYDNHTNDWEPTNARTGSLVVALALSALVLAPQRRETWFFLAVAVIGTWVGLGAWPLATLLHNLPLYDIAINDRLAMAAAFGFAMLAAIAADAWPADRRRAWTAAAIVLAVAIAVAVATALLRGDRIAFGVKPELITMLTFAALVPLAIVAALLALRIRPAVALPIVLGVLLLARTAEDGRIYPAYPTRMFYPTTPILRYMQQQNAATGNTAPFRMGAMHFMFLPDAAALYGLEDVRGYEAMTNLRLAETFSFWSVHTDGSYNNVGWKDRPMLSLLNLKYLIALPNEQPDEQWKVVMEDRNARLLENTRVLPRAFVPRRIRYEWTRASTLAALQQATDFSDLGWITTRDLPPHEIMNGPGTLDLRRNGRTFDITARMENEGWVILSETAWKGWRAYLDGKRIKTHPADHAFIGVFVPKGTHRLRITYQPESFTRGRNITVATAVALLAFFALRRYRLLKPRAVRV
jgi:hypothetical protein